MESKAFIIRVNFFAGGMINLYQLWLKDELDCTLDEITDEIERQTKAMLLLLNEKKWFVEDDGCNAIVFFKVKHF